LRPKVADQKQTSRRLRERIALSLPVRVSCRETTSHEWQEITRLIDVAPFGARLRLKRPTEIGRLLLLTMAMPRQLRCFDHVEDQYRVWSLVRNLKMLDPDKEKGALVEIGVAFVGKRPPPSFESNPARRYEISKAGGPAGSWTIHEESSEVLSEVGATDRRKESRHYIPTEVQIQAYAADGSFAESESTVTENISRHGAAVYTTLALEAGRFVRLSSPNSNVRIVAVIRERRVGPDGIARLHLQFTSGEWPL
jgi:PilZ domain